MVASWTIIRSSSTTISGPLSPQSKWIDKITSCSEKKINVVVTRDILSWEISLGIFFFLITIRTIGKVCQCKTSSSILKTQEA